MLQSMELQRARHDWAIEQHHQCIYRESRKVVLMNVFAGQE